MDQSKYMKLSIVVEFQISEYNTNTNFETIAIEYLVFSLKKIQSKFDRSKIIVSLFMHGKHRIN